LDFKAFNPLIFVKINPNSKSVIINLLNMMQKRNLRAYVLSNDQQSIYDFNSYSIHHKEITCT